MIDKLVNKNIIHKNKAAILKSKLTKGVNSYKIYNFTTNFKELEWALFFD